MTVSYPCYHYSSGLIERFWGILSHAIVNKVDPCCVGLKGVSADRRAGDIYHPQLPSHFFLRQISMAKWYDTYMPYFDCVLLTTPG